MSFEIYRPRGEKQNKQPVVSLSKSSIVLNSIAREKLNSKRLELAYDAETGRIRIRAVSEGGMELKKTKVFGKGFFHYFNIQGKGRYPALFDPDENALFIQL